MKKTMSVFLAVVFLTAVFTIPASAVPASDQIDSYSITIVSRGSGGVEVTANVIGTHPWMTRIGFPVITIYERLNSSSSWVNVRTVTSQWNPNATAGSHSHVLTYSGVAGRQYRAEVQFFARDSLGSDTRGDFSRIITAT